MWSQLSVWFSMIPRVSRNLRRFVWDKLAVTTVVSEPWWIINKDGQLSKVERHRCRSCVGMTYLMQKCYLHSYTWPKCGLYLVLNSWHSNVQKFSNGYLTGILQLQYLMHTGDKEHLPSAWHAAGKFRGVFVQLVYPYAYIRECSHARYVSMRWIRMNTGRCV